MTEPLAIETVQLRKRFGDVEALRGLDLEVPQGSLCGFLGRNGAGKTTAIKILLGMTRPSAGEARVFGLPAGDPRASVVIRRRAAFVSEDKALYPAMTAAEVIRFTASFYPGWRADLEARYSRRFALPLDARVQALSAGTRTKLALLVALCRGAELLVLDHPTSGLDPVMAEEVLQALVTHAADEGTTVLFSSHQIAHVEQIADRLAILDQGRCLVSGPLDDLRESYCRVDLVFHSEAPREATIRTPAALRVRRNGRILTVLSSGGASPILEEARAFDPVTVEVVPLGLKEIFLALVSEEG